MTLTPAEVAGFARGAGIPEAAVPMAVAIAKRESGLDPNAHNPRPPDDSYGLWQINMLGSLGPARRRQFGLAQNAELLDPATNARAMAAISSGGTNWRPWTTAAHVTAADLADAAAGAGAAGSPGGAAPPAGPDAGGKSANPLDWLDAAGEALGVLTAGATWIRVAELLGGLGLAVAGVLILATK